MHDIAQSADFFGNKTLVKKILYILEVSSFYQLEKNSLPATSNHSHFSSRFFLLQHLPPTTSSALFISFRLFFMLYFSYSTSIFYNPSYIFILWLYYFFPLFTLFLSLSSPSTCLLFIFLPQVPSAASTVSHILITGRRFWQQKGFHIMKNVLCKKIVLKSLRTNTHCVAYNITFNYS